MNILNEVVKKGNCCSCGLCAYLFSEYGITMEYNEKGYLRPSGYEKIDTSKNRILKKCCPGLNSVQPDLFSENLEKSKIMGKYKAAYIGYAADKDVRFSGASGGALSAYLIFLLETKKVDYIVHAGQSDSNPLDNSMFFSFTKEDVLKRSGSRYGQISPLTIVADIEKNEKTCALVGRPCDIMAIRNYIRYNRNKILNDRIRCFISFICAGTPSVKSTVNLINTLGINEKKVKHIRYRGNGWPGDAVVTDIEDFSARMSYKDSWGKILGKSIQQRCKICFDGIGEYADIVFGDAWHCDKRGYPIIDVENEGESIIIIRSSKVGIEFEESIKLNYLSIENKEITEEMFKQMQPTHTMRRQTSLYTYIGHFLALQIYPLQGIIRMLKISRHVRVYRNVRRLLGAFKRTIKGKEK